MSWIWLVACSEYSIIGNEEDVASNPEAEPPRATVHPPDEEICEVPLDPPGKVDVDASCVERNLEVPNPWAVRELWHWGGDKNTNVTATPIVAHLTDDDGDGDIDQDDGADVVVLAYDYDESPVLGAYGRMVALDGTTGAELWHLDGFSAVHSVGAADLDGDGVAELVGFDIDLLSFAFKLKVVRHDGTLLVDGDWIDLGGMDPSAPDFADIDGDGRLEVIVSGNVLDASTGELVIASGQSSWGYWESRFAPNPEGDWAVDYGPFRVTGAGTSTWYGELAGLGLWTAPLQLDADAGSEQVVVAADGVQTVDHDGMVLASTPGSWTSVGPSCVGDLDGDGEPELALVGMWLTEPYDYTSTLYGMELDGSLMFEVEVNDESGMAGCSAVDLDHDGADEILYAGDASMSVFDGTTGAVLFSRDDHNSITHVEYPVAADIDGDGDTELVYGSNVYSSSTANRRGVTVLEHNGSGWSATGTTWPSFAYVEDRVGPSGVSYDGTWGTRSRARATDDVPDLSNLDVEITEVCQASCEADEIVQFGISIANTGLADAAQSFDVYIFGHAGDDLLEHYVVDPLESGRTTGTLFFEATLADISDELVIRVDPNDDELGPDTVKECGEGNNVIRWSPTCD